MQEIDAPASERIVHFIRHGEADYNLLDRVNANAHVRNNLTETGREQAACCAKHLAQTRIEVMYCSAFPRAQQTAAILNQALAVPLIIDERLNETGAFAFEGKPAHLWHAANVPDRINAIVPGCEPLSDMKQRLQAFLANLRERPEQHIAVVSHEEPIQILLGLVHGIADADAKRRPISHCYPQSVALPRRAKGTAFTK